MVTSIHLAHVGAARALRFLRRPPRADGLAYAEAVTSAPLGPRLLPSPRPGRVGLIAHWRDDAALDAFLAGHHTAKLLDGGYFARMEPVRCFGEWPEFGALPGPGPAPVDGPVAALTLGRLKPTRALPFLRASARTEAAILESPALLLSSGLARPPLVSTFSVWESVDAMRAAVQPSHAEALATDAAKPFHRRSAFIRFAVREQRGTWR